MARPPKDPALKMSVDLRIPVTEEQKAMIVQAATNNQSDLASWVRPILIAAAQKNIKGQQVQTASNRRK